MDDVTSKEEVNIVRLDIPESEFIISGSDMSAQEMAMLLPQGVKNLYEDVLNIGSVSEPDVADAFRNYFIQDSARMHLVRDVEARFKDLSGLSKELGTLFGRLQKEVPEVDIPTFYTQISGFNQSIVVGDSIVGISLDKYMGADYAPYRKIFYRQQIAQMEPSRIAADCLTFWLTSEFPPPPPGKSSLLDQMIHYGKLNWAVYRLTEGQPDDYTYSLINNKEDNGHVWKKISKALLTPRYLTTTNERTVRTIMFGPPAHHQAFGSSLRATGIVAGVKIVDEYMKRHPSCTLKQLLTDTSSRKIFEGAGYSIR